MGTLENIFTDLMNTSEDVCARRCSPEGSLISCGAAESGTCQHPPQCGSVVDRRDSSSQKPPENEVISRVYIHAWWKALLHYRTWIFFHIIVQDLSVNPLVLLIPKYMDFRKRSLVHFISFFSSWSSFLCIEIKTAVCFLKRSLCSWNYICTCFTKW